MSLRAVFIAALTLAVFGTSASFAADDDTKNYRHKKYRHVYHRYHRTRVVTDGEEQKPYVYWTGGYSNSPYFDNRTFWDRIELAPDNSR